jgi:hypothetical protein
MIGELCQSNAVDANTSRTLEEGDHSPSWSNGLVITIRSSYECEIEYEYEIEIRNRSHAPIQDRMPRIVGHAIEPKVFRQKIAPHASVNRRRCLQRKKKPHSRQQSQLGE